MKNHIKRLANAEPLHRTIWVDACRGIGILLVLLGHNNPPFIKYIYGFHLPIFFILSGYLYKDKHTEMSPFEEFMCIVRAYIVPYCIFGLLNMALHIYHLKVVAPEVAVNRILIHRYLKGLILMDTENMPCCYPMWFLPAFGIAMFIFFLIRKLPAKWLRAIAFLAIVFVTVKYCNNPDKRLPYNMHASIPAVLFIEFGYILEHGRVIEKYVIERLHGRKKHVHLAQTVAVIIACLGIGYLGIRYNPVSSRVDMSCAQLGNIPLFFVGALFTCMGVFLTVILLGTYSAWIIRPFAYIGEHSVFFLSFDASTNSWGGSLITSIWGPISPAWNLAFAIRGSLLVGYFIVWQIFVKIFPRLKKVTHT